MYIFNLFWTTFPERGIATHVQQSQWKCLRGKGLPGENGLGSGGCLISGGRGGSPGTALVGFVLSAPSPPSLGSCLWACWAWRSCASSIVTAVCVAAAASPSGTADGADMGGEGGLGIGGVRGTPAGAVGWGILAGVGRGGCSPGSVGANALESCCKVSWLTFVLIDWTNWAVFTALLGWPRKFSRTASCSWVNWEVGPFGSVRRHQMNLSLSTNVILNLCNTSWIKYCKWLILLKEKMFYITVNPFYFTILR